LVEGEQLNDLELKNLAASRLAELKSKTGQFGVDGNRRTIVQITWTRRKWYLINGQRQK
jgi:hypothetical protein